MGGSRRQRLPHRAVRTEQQKQKGGKMRRSKILFAALAAALTVGMLVVPATVAGATAPLWVSNVATLGVAPGTSCAHPGYSTIQAAVNAAPSGATIKICQGTYVEQLNISTNVNLTAVGSVTVKLPSSPADSTTTCDTEIPNSYQANQDAVSICGATVNITGITVSAYWPASTCYDSMYGIFVGGGATLNASKVAVEGAGVPLGDPDVGCQGGVGILVGSARTSPNEAATAALHNVAVSGYQKGGIVAEGTGTTITMNQTAIQGRGPVAIAQNGIQISYGAKGTITQSSISGNECDIPAPTCGPDGQNNAESIGVLFYGAAAGSSLRTSTLSGNDLGVYYASSAATEPARAEVTITSDTLTSNRYEQIQFDQGRAQLNNSTISGSGNVGIQVIQYSGQSYAPLPSCNR